MLGNGVGLFASSGFKLLCFNSVGSSALEAITRFTVSLYQT